MPRCGQNRAKLFRAERPQLWRRYRSKYLQNLAQQNLDPSNSLQGDNRSAQLDCSKLASSYARYENNHWTCSIRKQNKMPL